MMPAKKIILLTGLLILVLTSLAAAKLNPDKEELNVLFIVLDTCRSDHLGCYGYKKVKTPNIDALAAHGTRFNNVISQIPLTAASHASMFTSTYPQYNKVRDNGSFRLDKTHITLAEVLQDNGYATAAFVASIVLDGKYGLNQGFQTYDDKMSVRKTKRVIKFMDEERTADQITVKAAEWLKENKDKKFFLWAHYYDPHTIYNPPSPYKEIYKDNLYDGEIAFSDQQIGILFSVLKDLGLDKKTLVIFCSDHGEGLGEHGESGHAVFIYDSTLKVPLIFSCPGLIPEGKTITERVRLVDIMPTLLELLHLKKNKEIQGVSLAGFIRGKEKPRDLPAYSESFYAQYHFNWSSLQSWHDREWKYIKSTEPELYNLKDDAYEFTNLAKERTDIVGKMDAELEKFLKKTTSAEKEKKVKADGQTREKLMSLGYIQGSVNAGKEPVPGEMVQVMEKMNLADRQANAGLLQQAIVGYKEVIKLDPGNMEAYLHMAQCYKEQENYGEAIKYFKKAASFKPEEPEVHNGLGNIYKNMGKVDMAFEEFQLALKMEPDDPALINNIGWCYQQKLDFDKAMEYYRQALKKENNLPTAHANMAICYRIKGQLDKAIEELNIAIKQDPELAFAHSELCASIATRGDIDGAIPHCQKAVELDPNGLDGYVNLGVCYERKGEYAKALENYRKALEIAPWHALTHCNIGNVYMKLKQYDKARQHFKKALEINPSYQKARQALEILTQQEK